MVAAQILSALPQGEKQETLSRCLEDSINSLSAEQIYNHSAHNFTHSGDRLRGGCPLHQSSSGSSFVVTISSKLFWCEGCQFGGGPADYRASLKIGRWIKARGKDFVEAVRELAAEANVRFPERESSPEEIAKAQKWERRRAVLAETQEYCKQVLWSEHPAALEARRYLVAERGLTEEEIHCLPIGYYPSAGELKQHLISKGFSTEDWQGTGCVWKDLERYITFLWSDSSGRPLTMYGRYYTKIAPDHKPKTIALPGERTKQSPLYFDRTLKAGHKEAVLVEGVLDAVLLQAKGDTRVCAYVAASCSGDQIQTLKRRGITKVTLCGDPDHGGDRGTNSNLLRLTEAGISVYVAPKLPDGLDPDEFLVREGIKGWNVHIEAAQHGFRWKAQRLIESGDVATDKGKAAILSEAIAFCKAIKNHLELDVFFWPIIRNSLGMEPDEFRAQLEALWESSSAEVASPGGRGGDGGDDGEGGDRKVINHPKFSALSTDEVDAKIDGLIAQGLTGSRLTSEFNWLAAECQRHVSEIRRQYYERKGELEQTDEEAEAQSNLPALLIDRRLTLSDFLWGDNGVLAQAISDTAKAMPTSPEFLFTTLLPTASTLIGTSSRVVVKAKGKYKQPCVFWATVVARSGELKTPAQSVILDPLVRLEIEENQKYLAELEEYEISLASWKKDKDADPADKPKLPVRKRFLTKDATIEALERIHGNSPRGILVHRDELAEDFKADNAYRNGKGGDREKKLDQWNGSPLIIDRKEREVVLERSAINRTGSMQWEILQNQMGDCHDDNGLFARWLFCAAKSPLRLINLLEDDQDTGIDDLLRNLYKRLEKMPSADYLLSFGAKEIFQQWQHKLVHRERKENHPGLQLVYPKIEAYTARFALWLHVVNSALAEVTPEPTISASTMSAAVKLAQYYLNQYELIMAANSPQSGLTGLLLKIHKFSQGKSDGVAPRQLKAGIRALKKLTTDEIKKHCLTLATQGYGRFENSRYYVDAADAADVLLTPVSTAVSGSESTTQKCVDIVDSFANSPIVPVTVEVPQQDKIEQNTLLGVSTVSTVNNDAQTLLESGVDANQENVNVASTASTASTSETFPTRLEKVEAIAPTPTPVEQAATTPADELIAPPTDAMPAWLAERFKYCTKLSEFKVLSRDQQRTTIEAALELASESDKERLVGYWERIKAKFVN